MARPPYRKNPKDQATVRALVSYGVPHDKVAPIIGVTPKTLRKHYRHDLDLAHIEANAHVAQGLYKAATEWCTPRADGKRPPPLTREAAICMMFWLKTRAGWSERVTLQGSATVVHEGKVVHEHNAADREALEIMAQLESQLPRGSHATAGLGTTRSH